MLKRKGHYQWKSLVCRRKKKKREREGGELGQNIRQLGLLTTLMEEEKIDGKTFVGRKDTIHR